MSSAPDPAAPPWAPGYRHLTADVAPIAFRFRTRPEDFLVQEVPIEEPAGEGTHVFFELEKRGVSTVDAVRRLARALERPEGDFGFAGRKDAFAVTRQWISIEHVDSQAVEALEWPDLRLRTVGRHTKKLRLGQLAGNRFRLRLVGLAPTERGAFDAVLAALARTGLPNYYGNQRFGRHGLTYRLGRLLVQRRPAEYLAELVSPAQTAPSQAVEELAVAIRSGTLSVQRRLKRLAASLPPDLAAVAHQLARRPGDPASAVRAIPKRTRRFHLSAFQSRIFNRVLAARLAAALPIGTCVPGDVAFEHASGRVHALAPDRPVGAQLQSRCSAFELSPSGPMPGTATLRPEGVPGELEAAALAAEGVALADFEGLPEGFAKSGARRPLRVPVTELSTTWREDGVELCFRLPKGSYATTLLEELLKEHSAT